jgi:hypothetical protein
MAPVGGAPKPASPSREGLQTFHWRNATMPIYFWIAIILLPVLIIFYFWNKKRGG